MKIYRLLPVAIVAAAIAGCSGDPASTLVQPEADALVRFVNAVPDTAVLDYRFVDIVTNASEPNLQFRGTTNPFSSGAYERLTPGTHRIKVFISAANASIGNGPSAVSQFVLDTTLTFAVNHYYTITHAGYAKAGATPTQQFYVTDDVFPTPTSTQISFRVINAVGTVPSVDVYAAIAAATGGALPPAKTFAAVPFGTTTAYTTVNVAPSTPAANSYRIAFTSAGSATVLGEALGTIGLPAVAATTTTAALGAVAGTQQGGSVLTFLLVPPGVSWTGTFSGTSASPPQGTTTVVAGAAGYTVLSMIDKNP